MIVLEDGGSRHLVLVDPALAEPLTTVHLSDTDAGVVAGATRRLAAGRRARQYAGTGKSSV